MVKVVRRIIGLILLFLPFGNLDGQDHASSVLKELLKEAVTNYPLLKSKGYEVQAAEKGVDASKRALVPTLDASY